MIQLKDIQETPNPNALKFVLDQVVTPQPLSYFNAEAAAGHELARRLFGIEGVCGVLILNDFVTVSKRPEVKWSRVRLKVKSILSSIERPT